MQFNNIPSAQPVNAGAEIIQPTLPEPEPMPVMDFYGVDVGDGESAVSWSRSDTQTEPQMLEIRGSKSILSALGMLRDGATVIGEEACQLADPMALHLRFKSRYLSDTQTVSRYIQAFASAIVADLRADGRISEGKPARCAIGCPSGWNGQTRRGYSQLFAAAGFPNVRLVSESRAAFLYSRESGELRMSNDMLGKPTLIIDAGSSTTDFTFVEELAEQRLPVRDFGETALGGGLIEQELLRLNLEKLKDKNIADILDRFPQCRSRCEMEARKVKEMYFTRKRRGHSDSIVPCESSVKLYCTMPPTTVDISCTDEDMEAVLTRPMPELNGMSYIDAYRKSLVDAREVLGRGVSVVLMTGGASRMDFMPRIAAEVFPEALIVHGIEPEFAIARGLCYALRIDAHAEAFTRDVEQLIKSSAVQEIVKSELNRLFSEIARPITKALTEEIATPVFKRWRVGAIETIDDIAKQITADASTYFSSDSMKELLRPYIVKWLDDLRPQLEALTDPICDRYDLPRTALRFNSAMSLAPGDIGLTSGQLMSFDGIKVLLDVVVASLFAVIMGSTETALIATGPLGMLIGAVVGLIFAVIGSEAADRKLRKVNIPVRLRKLYTEKRFQTSLERKQDEIAYNVFDSLMEDLQKPTEDITRMINEIADCLETELRDMLNRAVMLIR